MVACGFSHCALRGKKPAAGDLSTPAPRRRQSRAHVADRVTVRATARMDCALETNLAVRGVPRVA